MGFRVARLGIMDRVIFNVKGPMLAFQGAGCCGIFPVQFFFRLTGCCGNFPTLKALRTLNPKS